MSNERIAPFARRQHGLVTKAQALDVITADQLKRSLRDRGLEPVRRGVYRVAGAPESWHQHLLAVCLAAGPRARSSFRSAAALHQLEAFPAEILEITHFGVRPAVIDGVIAHETKVYGPAHVASVQGIPVTSVARTLCDLTAIAPSWSVERAVDEALRRKLVTLRWLRSVAEDLEGRGRLRCTVMREILEVRQPGYHPGDSEPEKRISDLLVRAGFPRPVPQHTIRIGSRTYRADLAYPELMLVMEYDSWAFHSSRSAFDNDPKRRNDMRTAGYTVLEFTSKSSDRYIVDTVAAARALRASAS